MCSLAARLDVHSAPRYGLYPCPIQALPYFPFPRFAAVVQKTEEEEYTANCTADGRTYFKLAADRERDEQKQRERETDDQGKMRADHKKARQDGKRDGEGRGKRRR